MLRIESRKILVPSLVLLALALLVTFNFDRFSGEAVKTRTLGQETTTKIYVSADEDVASQDHPLVRAGHRVFFTVDVGSKGSKNALSIYDANSPRALKLATVTLHEGCGGSACRPYRRTSGFYHTLASWRGRYCAGLYDKGLKKEVESCFTVQ